MNSQFELFGPLAIENTIEECEYQQFSPISALQHGTPIEFIIPGNDMQYLNLTNSFLRIIANIVTPANANIPNGADVGPINYVLNSLFSKVDIDLGGKMISDPNGLYPYRAYIETILSQSKAIQDSQLQSAGWCKDTAGQMEDFRSVPAGANNGLKYRARLFAEGRHVELMGRLHCDIFHQPLAILSNIALKVKLIPSIDRFILVTPTPAQVGDQPGPQTQYKIIIIEATLFIEKMKVTKALALAHETMLQKVNARYPIDRVEMKPITIPVGQTSANFDGIFNGQIPSRIVLVMVTDASMAGGYQQQPFNFQHFSLNFLSLSVNTTQIPNRAYQPDFVSGRYIRSYMSMFQGMGIMFSDRTITINREEYPGGYAIWVFKLKPDQASPTRTGSIRLEIKFAAATTQTVNILLHATFESLIEIDKFRNVIVAF